MGTTAAALLTVCATAAVLAVVHVPLGDHIARVYSSDRHRAPERWFYRAVGVDPAREQTWGAYARSLLAFSAVSVLGLYLIQRLQGGALGGVAPDTAWNTAISFVTNTNWQSYPGESTMAHLTQMTGLAVQNFVSAAVGLAVAMALVRGFVRRRTDRLGNFWVDLTRGVTRILLPIAAVGAVVLLAAGVVQNFGAGLTVRTLAGAAQTITGGPVASQEVIKELGTNGGGFYNANSAHPFENPAGWTSWLQVLLMLAVPFSLPRAFGRLVGDKRQGVAIVAVMAAIFVGSFAVNAGFQDAHPGTVPQAVGASAEGVETRFGVPQSALFATTTTGTSTGAVNSFHDSYTAIGGATLMVNMMLGEVAPGGVGSGLYGILLLAIVTVFVAGLMIGRTPEYLGKKVGSREIRLVSLYLLTTPALVLVGTAVAMALPGQRAGMLNSGAHGLSEVLYAFTSAANNNGSAFAGITVSTAWYNTVLGVVMALGRFVPILLVLALAGSLARQQPVPPSAGTLPTHRPQFAGLLTGVTLILVALTFFPALALGPLAEGIA
jgi:potassium-transporting ATPase potassium-binding subunit